MLKLLYVWYRHWVFHIETQFYREFSAALLSLAIVCFFIALAHTPDGYLRFYLIFTYQLILVSLHYLKKCSGSMTSLRCRLQIGTVILNVVLVWCIPMAGRLISVVDPVKYEALVTLVKLPFHTHCGKIMHLYLAVRKTYTFTSFVYKVYVHALKHYYLYVCFYDELQYTIWLTHIYMQTHIHIRTHTLK